MKKELIAKYELLYLKYIKDNEVFDYEKLLEIYSYYLYIFSDSDSKFFRDVEFIKLVIDGFKYYTDLLFGVEDYSSLEVSDLLKEYEGVIRYKFNTKDEYSNLDKIYTFSFELVSYFLDNDMFDLAFSYGNKGLKSVYRVLKLDDNIEIKRCDLDELEYWKRKN